MRAFVCCVVWKMVQLEKIEQKETSLFGYASGDELLQPRIRLMWVMSES